MENSQYEASYRRNQFMSSSSTSRMQVSNKSAKNTSGDDYNSFGVGQRHGGPRNYVNHSISDFEEAAKNYEK